MDYIYKDGNKLLSDYYKGILDNRIKYRREELSQNRHDPSELGVRVQATRRNDVLENEAIRNIEDVGIHHLKRQHRVVEKFLKYLKFSSTGKKTERILFLHYTKGLTYTVIGNNVGLAGSTCGKRRRKAVEELEEWLNIQEE